MIGTASAPMQLDKTLRHAPHAPERVGIVAAEPRCLECQRFFAKSQGVGVPAELEVAGGNVAHAPERAGMRTIPSSIAQGAEETRSL